MGKHDSYTEYNDRKDAALLARVYQPKWVLRKKSYKPLAPGVPDYAVGNEWKMPSVRPTELPYVFKEHIPKTVTDGRGIDPTVPKPRVLFNSYEELSSMKDLHAKRTAVTMQERVYLSHEDIQRRVGGQPDYWKRPMFAGTAPSGGVRPVNYAHSKALLAQTMPAVLPSRLKSASSDKSGKTVRFGGVHSQYLEANKQRFASLETMQSLQRPVYSFESPRGRKGGALTGYYENLAKYHTNQLLRDQRAKVI